MVSKLGGVLVLMATMLGGCAVWTHTPAHTVAYDYSDHEFYDHAFATSPVYTENSVGNVMLARGPVEDQTAPSRAKTAVDSKGEGEGADIPEITAPPAAKPPARGGIPGQTTSPGSSRGGRSSANDGD